jgi:hypothetical protein
MVQYANLEAADSVGWSRQAYWNGVQSAARDGIYRGKLGVYRVEGVTPAAIGKASANPHVTSTGKGGGLPQLYIEDVSQLRLIEIIDLVN